MWWISKIMWFKSQILFKCSKFLFNGHYFRNLIQCSGWSHFARWRILGFSMAVIHWLRIMSGSNEIGTCWNISKEEKLILDIIVLLLQTWKCELCIHWNNIYMSILMMKDLVHLIGFRRYICGWARYENEMKYKIHFIKWKYKLSASIIINIYMLWLQTSVINRLLQWKC